MEGLFSEWPVKQYWIGAYDVVVEGVFVWEHNNVALTSTFTSWGASQPSGSIINYCVFVNGFLFWEDVKCYQKMKCICEYEAR